MFGAFYSGYLYFGESIWGPSAPVRTNPDIDGVFIPAFPPTVDLIESSFESGNYIRQERIESNFSEADSVQNGVFIRLESPIKTIYRIK